MTEEDLLAAIRKGDQNAFRELVSLFQTRVHNTALSFLQNREDAEDVSQEVFVEVYNSATSFRGDSKVSTWIYRITVNRSLDLLRSRKRKKRFAIVKSIFGEDSVAPRWDKGHFEHPGVLLENRERAAILFDAINRLPERQKAAFILQKVEGLSQKETAESLGISESAAESLVGRALAALRNILGDFYNENRRT